MESHLLRQDERSAVATPEGSMALREQADSSAQEKSISPLDASLCDNQPMPQAHGVDRTTASCFIAPTRGPKPSHTRYNVHSVSMPYDAVSDLVRQSILLWSHKYQHWFPIINPRTLEGHLDSTTTESQHDIVAKAITAVVLLDLESSTASELQIAESLRSEVFQNGMSVASLQSVQALLVLSNHYYNSGQFTLFWNILAICQRYVKPLVKDVMIHGNCY